MANAIVGTLILICMASAIGLPIGIGAGLYLAEIEAASLRRCSLSVRRAQWTAIDRDGHFRVAISRPAIGAFSALAGGIALGAMMIPLVTRTTEEMIRLVPVSLREAALALGYSRWRTSLSVVLRTALPES